MLVDGFDNARVNRRVIEHKYVFTFFYLVKCKKLKLPNYLQSLGRVEQLRREDNDGVVPPEDTAQHAHKLGALLLPTTTDPTSHPFPIVHCR